jgi:hypothetical protein
VIASFLFRTCFEVATASHRTFAGVGTVRVRARLIWRGRSASTILFLREVSGLAPHSLVQELLHLRAEVLVLGVVLQFGNRVAHEHGRFVTVEGYLQAG